MPDKKQGAFKGIIEHRNDVKHLMEVRKGVSVGITDTIRDTEKQGLITVGHLNV